MTSDPIDAPAGTPSKSGEFTEILNQGGFKTVDGQKKQLAKHGIRSEVICPPGVNLNG